MTEQNKEDPKQQQLMIAEGMGIKPEVVNFLEKIPDWKLRELYYLCAADRMPLSNMIELAKKENTTWDEIKKKRVEYLKQIYTDLEPIGQEIVELKKEVKGVFDESQSARDLIANNIEKAIEKQAAAQEETIRSKNEQIEMLQSRIAELSKQKEDESKIQFPQNYEVTSFTLPKKPMGGFFKRFSPKDEVKTFINRILPNKNMDDEHISFFISCMEEGYTLKEIEAFASPDLSIEQMKRLRDINRGKGGR